MTCPPETQPPALEAFLLGQVDFDRVLALQQRLILQCRDRDDGQITLLLCEHPAIITVGRSGSPGHVAMQSGLVRSRQVDIRWVNRGGGCLVHCPGQLAIYPLVPLRWHGLSVGDFLDRLQAAIINTLGDLNVPSHTASDAESRRVRPADQNDAITPGMVRRADQDDAKTSGLVRVADPTSETQSSYGIWGRTGQLATLGVAVRHWVTYHGAYLNVCPPMGLLRLAENGSFGQSRMSSLVAERCGQVRMTAVRAALVARLSERFGCDRYHLYTGHPLLRRGS